MTDALDDFASEATKDDADPAVEGEPTFASEAVPGVGAGDALDEFPMAIASVAPPPPVASDALDEFPIAIAPLPLTLMPAPADGLDDGRLRDSHFHEQPTLPGRSRASIWMVSAALLVGLACGFGGGYVVGSRLGPPDEAQRSAVPVAPVATQLAPPSAPSPAARDYTEGALIDPPVVAGRGPDRRDTGREAAPVQSPTDPSTATGRVLVRSTPADAQVFVDGQERGRTPATIRDLAPGAHRIRVVREGYVTEDRPITITTERPAQSVTMTMAPSRVAPASAARSSAPGPPAADGALVGALDVESRPPDAQVFLDGTFVGTTPFASTRIGTGRHEIRLELSGYRRWQSSVSIVGGERNRITASLEQ